jgi:hypothetical protein
VTRLRDDHGPVGFRGGQHDLFMLGEIWQNTLEAGLPARPSESLTVLNKFGPSGSGEAQVQYLDGDFRVVSPGTYVRCAVTDVRIPLDELKYWSVDLQEAYAVPIAVLRRHYPRALKQG